MKQSVMVCLAAKNLISMFRKMRLASSRHPRADFINVKILNVRKIMSRCFSVILMRDVILRFLRVQKFVVLTYKELKRHHYTCQVNKILFSNVKFEKKFNCWILFNVFLRKNYFLKLNLTDLSTSTVEINWPKHM